MTDKRTPIKNALDARHTRQAWLTGFVAYIHRAKVIIENDKSGGIETEIVKSVIGEAAVEHVELLDELLRDLS